MTKQISDIVNDRSWLYCFLRGEKAVYLNRWDQTIKEFDTYAEALIYAKEHPELIDIKIRKK